MPNKKALRNNNRKTKRAPPKASSFTEIDKEINILLGKIADCAGRTNRCEMCEDAKGRINILLTFKKAGITEKGRICCYNPECISYKEIQDLILK